MSRLLIIGCGGVAQVAIRKCCQNSEVFTEIMIASRTKSKCDDLKAKLEGKTSTKIETAKVDADNVEELKELINAYKPDAVLNVALPYQDLTIMDACLACGVDYIDTANYECEDTENPKWRAIYEKRCKELGFTAYFDYSWQWAYQEKFKEAGLTAILGSGFDPGVTSVYSASFSSSLEILIIVPSLYADSMVWPKVVSLSGISSPSSIQLASPVSSAMGILRVPELVRITMANFSNYNDFRIAN